MKKKLLLFVVIVIAQQGVFSQSRRQAKVTNVSADSVVSIVYSILEEFSKEASIDYPVFKEASLSLESSVKFAGGGGFEIPLIAEGSGELSKETTSKVTFNIKPQKSTEEVIAELSKDPNFGPKIMADNAEKYKQIQDAAQAAKGRRKAKREKVMSIVDKDGMVKFLSETNRAFIKSQQRQNQTYRLDGFDIEFTFTMTITAEGKVKFTILGVGGNFGGGFERNYVHTISISYSAKESNPGKMPLAMQ